MQRRSLFAALMALSSPSALAAQDVSRAQLDELARDVSRVESLREVKDLQRFYAQFAQFGLTAEMAALFTDDAEFVRGDQTIRGRAAIEAWLATHIGPRGLTDGALHTEFIEDPLVNLSVDGQSAKSRWMSMTMAGDGRGGAAIKGGIYENEYVLEGGSWKLSRMHYYPQYEGSYADGWTNVNDAPLKQFPFHFTVDETGIPIPKPEGAAPPSNATLATLEQRIGALNVEDEVRNLQNAYGYYVDRKMWDDVVDLFAPDARVKIVGVGTFEGAEGVREAMERMGPQDLQQGDFNDHPLFDTIVTVDAGQQTAHTRGLELGMKGTSDSAGWSFAVFRNKFVFHQGLWKIAEMRIYPLMEADYATGWGNGGTSRLQHGILPAFNEPHLVTGQPVEIEGFVISGANKHGEVLDPPLAVQTGTGEAERYIDAKRRLQRSWAYDGVVNVSSAYGYYLDDFYWVELASIFAENGNKHSPFAGFYLGRDRIEAAATTMWGQPPEYRDSIAFHWRFQPVIDVSHDGRSANLRTRLFQPRTGLPLAEGETPNYLSSAGFNSGMYSNDQAVLEDGIWRLWSLTIDEHYMVTQNWREGWAGVAPVEPGQAAGQSPLVERLPPDILMTELGRRAEHFRGGTGVTYAWPDILPMWFHYKNPVSGRVPEYYWPDSVPGLGLPESRLIANRYQMPPNGPDQDGIHIELTSPDANEMEGKD